MKIPLEKSISFELHLPSALRSRIFFVEKDIRYLRSTRKLCYRVLEKKTRLSQSFVQINPTPWCLQSPPRTIKLLGRPLEHPQFPSSEAIPVEASLLKRSAIKTIKPWQPGRGLRTSPAFYGFIKSPLRSGYQRLNKVS